MKIFRFNCLEHNANRYQGLIRLGLESESWVGVSGKLWDVISKWAAWWDSFVVSAREEPWSRWKDERIIESKLKQDKDSVVGHELVFLKRNRD